MRVSEVPIPGRAVLWTCGVIAAIVVVMAAALFASGDSLAAIKLLLVAGLTPGVALIVGVIWGILGRQRWYLRPRDATTVAFFLGLLMVIAPLILFMPWAPARFRLDEMPLGLSIVVAAGIPLFAGGALLEIALAIAEAWRARDFARFIGGLLLAVMIAAIVTLALIGQRANGH